MDRVAARFVLLVAVTAMSFSASEDGTYTRLILCVGTLHFFTESEFGARLTFSPTRADCLTTCFALFYGVVLILMIMLDYELAHNIFVLVFAISDSTVMVLSLWCVAQTSNPAYLRRAGFGLFLHVVGVQYEVYLLLKSGSAGEPEKLVGSGWFIIGMVLPVQVLFFKEILKSPPSRDTLENTLVGRCWLLLLPFVIAFVLAKLNVPVYGFYAADGPVLWLILVGFPIASFTAVLTVAYYFVDIDQTVGPLMSEPLQPYSPSGVLPLNHELKGASAV